jgi:Peptidase S46
MKRSWIRRWPGAAALVLMPALILALAPSGSEEGMYPVSEIPKLDLRAKGLEIAPEEIFSPDRIGLVYGIVQVGATGSFVSPDGLILTNHHVAFGAAQAASTRENDYIRDGFLARTRDREIEAKGMTARITETFRDVSAEVLAAVKPSMDPAARTKAVEQKIKEIVAAAEKANPGRRAEVSEMFAGKTYVLFLYAYLKDIRLVYVPPRSIGEFGGEEDNWMWPRHTGDFSFLRAYVGPDGGPADFAAANVPFKPKRFLKVAPEGVRENDFVFLLGYPGRTYRHAVSPFLAYEEEVRMPYVADWYAWQIALMEKMGEGDRAVALKHAARIKGLANTMKNYRGKLQGMARVGIVERKREEERRLEAFVAADPARRAKYAGLLAKFAAVYDEMRADAEYRLLLGSLRSNVNLLSFASTIHEASLERPKKDIERESAYMDRNFAQTKRRVALALDNYYEPTDRAVFRELLVRLAHRPEAKALAALAPVVSAADPVRAAEAYVDDLCRRTRLGDKAFVLAALDKPAAEVKAWGDPLIELAAALYPEAKRLQKREESWNGTLDALYPQLLEVKSAFQAQDFIPDANSTLRLTFGRVKGYVPRDAVFYRPFTTLDGVLEKSTGREPFDTPQKLFDLRTAGDFGRFKPEGFPSVPACVLYDADTTGGNSGSPVLNARGELVAVNFDRTYEATINDYAWSADYSRSIGVDIRYVLWVTDKFAGAGFLLEEMGVSGGR